MLILRKEAEEDIRAAYEWYEQQRAQLGAAFIAELDHTFEAIDEQPEAYTQCFGAIRRALCRKFPYAVYFTRKNSYTVVIAVLHQRRQSATWKSRG